MEEATKILINVRVESADEDLETAKELLKLNRYRAAVNRAYYAIFSTTNAVLLSKQIERSKHSGVESAFIQNFISDTESKFWGVLRRPPGHHRKLPDPPPPAIAWRRIQLQSWHTWQWRAGATAHIRSVN